MTTSSAYRRHREAERGLALQPVRIVHLGVGAFHRSHQAWYTHRVNQASVNGWGIAAFTGRSPAVAETLAAQDGLYHLVTRGPEADVIESVASLSEVHPGGDAAAWRAAVAAPATRVVTLTITEKGYRLAGEGPDLGDPDVSADIELLRRWTSTAPLPSTAPARLVDGLLARRAAGGGPLAIASCDNLPANGDVTRSVVRAIADAVDPSLATWIDANVRFPSSVVDRITPASALSPIAFSAGLDDVAPVVAEPHSEWVLVDDFPGGRPAWETVGVRFVSDVRPYEERKLWMLNGAHTLLAVVGRARGLETVAAAIADPVCSALVEQLWDDAAALIDLPDGDLVDYRASLRERFGNARLDHRLEQIAVDADTKIGVRILPLLDGARAAGRGLSAAAVEVVAAWMFTHPAATDAAQTLSQLGGSREAADPEIVDAVRSRLAALRADELRAAENTGGHR